MITWICKARAYAVLAVLGLAACDALPASTSNGSAKAITQRTMARGTVQLTAPTGYCIDPRSARDRFVLLGRCDTLGVEGFFNPWDIAIITASITQVENGTTNPRADDLAAAPNAGEVLSTIERDSIALVQLRRAASSIEGVADIYWRTAFVLNDQLVSATLYAPPESPALGREGARILESLVRATRRATAQLAG